MTSPSSYKFDKKYCSRQLERVLANLDRIVARPSVQHGRTIPTPDNLTIHDGKHIEATIMFLDISNFSIRPAWTDNEQRTVLNILSLLFTEMIQIIEDHKGVIEKNTGDGLMAYFAHDASDNISIQERSLSAALSMFYALDNLINPILKQSDLEQLQFRICMDHGPVTIAKIGSPRRFNGIVAVGTTANIASKMLSLAEPNSILLGGKMAESLPANWMKFLKFKTVETGWSYRETNTLYPFWEYTGRWKEPIS